MIKTACRVMEKKNTRVHRILNYRSVPLIKLPVSRVTDLKYLESLDRFEKSKTLKLFLKNALRELSSKTLFRFSTNVTFSRNSLKTKVHHFTLLNMQNISEKLTNFLVFALKLLTCAKLRTKASAFFYQKLGSFNSFNQFEGFRRLLKNCLFKLLQKR